MYVFSNAEAARGERYGYCHRRYSYDKNFASETHNPNSLEQDALDRGGAR
jgi:hypothetical protein